MSTYPLLEYMSFYTDISDGFAKMRATILLGDIVRLHQCTKNTLNYVNKNSKYGHLVAIPDFDTQDSFSRDERCKGSVDKVFSICQSENGKIRWPWHNTCQSICLRNMKMKQF